MIKKSKIMLIERTMNTSLLSSQKQQYHAVKTTKCIRAEYYEHFNRFVNELKDQWKFPTCRLYKLGANVT